MVERECGNDIFHLLNCMVGVVSDADIGNEIRKMGEGASLGRRKMTPGQAA